MPRQNKIERAFSLYTKNMEKYGTGKVADIAKKLEISPRTVRGYVYRMRNPDKYKAAVQRYVKRKAEKKAEEKAKAEKKKSKRKARKSQKKEKGK